MNNKQTTGLNLKLNTTKYYCPMHCEGNKTYDALGDCPVCGMHLVPVDGEKKANNNHYKIKS